MLWVTPPYQPPRYLPPPMDLGPVLSLTIKPGLLRRVERSRISGSFSGSVDLAGQGQISRGHVKHIDNAKQGGGVNVRIHP